MRLQDSIVMSIAEGLRLRLSGEREGAARRIRHQTTPRRTSCG